MRRGKHRLRQRTNEIQIGPTSQIMHVGKPSLEGGIAKIIKKWLEEVPQKLQPTPLLMFVFLGSKTKCVPVVE